MYVYCWHYLSYYVKTLRYQSLYYYSRLLQKQLVTTKYNAQQVVKEVTAAVAAASQGAQQQQQQQQQQQHSDSEDEEEFGAASTYANYQPAKCMFVCVTQFMMLVVCKLPCCKWNMCLANEEKHNRIGER